MKEHESLYSVPVWLPRGGVGEGWSVPCLSSWVTALDRVAGDSCRRPRRRSREGPASTCSGKVRAGLRGLGRARGGPLEVAEISNGWITKAALGSPRLSCLCRWALA